MILVTLGVLIGVLLCIGLIGYIAARCLGRLH
jgi:hypothetical protein